MRRVHGSWAIWLASDRLAVPQLPTLLAGDFNGDSSDPVYKAVLERGYRSSAKEVLGREVGVTHLTHNGKSTSVDFIFFRSDRRPAALKRARSLTSSLTSRRRAWASTCSRSWIMLVRRTGRNGAAPVGPGSPRLQPIQLALLPTDLPDAVRSRSRGPFSCRGGPATVPVAHGCPLSRGGRSLTGTAL